MKISENEFTFLGSDISNIDTDGDGISDPVKFKSSYDLKEGFLKYQLLFPLKYLKIYQ